MQQPTKRNSITEASLSYRDTTTIANTQCIYQVHSYPFNPSLEEFSTTPYPGQVLQTSSNHLISTCTPLEASSYNNWAAGLTVPLATFPIASGINVNETNTIPQLEAVAQESYNQNTQASVCKPVEVPKNLDYNSIVYTVATSSSQTHHPMQAMALDNFSTYNTPTIENFQSTETVHAPSSGRNSHSTWGQVDFSLDGMYFASNSTEALVFQREYTTDNAACALLPNAQASSANDGYDMYASTIGTTVSEYIDYQKDANVHEAIIQAGGFSGISNTASFVQFPVAHTDTISIENGIRKNYLAFPLLKEDKSTCRRSRRLRPYRPISISNTISMGSLNDHRVFESATRSCVLPPSTFSSSRTSTPREEPLICNAIPNSGSMGRNHSKSTGAIRTNKGKGLESPGYETRNRTAKTQSNCIPERKKQTSAKLKTTKKDEGGESLAKCRVPLTERQRSEFFIWLYRNQHDPKPKGKERERLRQIDNMPRYRFKTWFANARRRYFEIKIVNGVQHYVVNERFRESCRRSKIILPE